jgi:hypothetical protein
MAVVREEIVDVCRAALETMPAVQAAFLGGSESFGRQDRYSDIDLCCVAPSSEAKPIFTAVEGALETLSPIALKLVMPPSQLWPGLTQRFYRLRETDEFLMIDFCQLTPEQVTTFLEPIRHGTPVVLFDRAGVIKPVELDRAQHDMLVGKRLAWVRDSFPMFQNLARKAALRGDLVEAQAVWVSHTLRPLVDLLRIRYCPERFDFGMRYTGIDLPEHTHAELHALLLPTGGPDLLAKLDLAAALFARTLAEIDEQEGAP